MAVLGVDQINQQTLISTSNIQFTPNITLDLASSAPLNSSQSPLTYQQPYNSVVPTSLEKNDFSAAVALPGGRAGSTVNDSGGQGVPGYSGLSGASLPATASGNTMIYLLIGGAILFFAIKK